MHELMEFLNQHNIVKAFGLSLLHSLWQGAAIAAFLWLLLKITAHASARLRYWFALTALCSLLVAFACTLHIQLNNLSASQGITADTEAFVLLSADTAKQAMMEKNLLQELETGLNTRPNKNHQHFLITSGHRIEPNRLHSDIILQA